MLVVGEIIFSHCKSQTRPGVLVPADCRGRDGSKVGDSCFTFRGAPCLSPEPLSVCQAYCWPSVDSQEAGRVLEFCDKLMRRREAVLSPENCNTNAIIGQFPEDVGLQQQQAARGARDIFSGNGQEASKTRTCTAGQELDREAGQAAEGQR